MKLLIISLCLAFSGMAEFEWKSPQTHNFGNIVKGEPVTHTFTFKNTGDEPLLIVQAKGSCGCTVPEYTKEAILPGETGEVKVTYDARKAGKFMKSVTLTANTAEEQVTLFVTGEVLE